MHAHKVIVPVPASRRVEIDLPADFPEGDAEFIAISTEPEHRSLQAPAGSVVAMRAGSAVIDKMDFPRRSKNQIDRDIAEERASWGDEP